MVTARVFRNIQHGLLAGAFCLLTGLLAAVSLSPTAGWPDSDGYALGVEDGRWVAHPPGYLLFMATGHAVAPLVRSGYEAVLSASFLLTLASTAAMVLLCARIGGCSAAIWLGGAYSLSWLTIMLCTTGTPHGGDMFLVALLLMVVWSDGFLKSTTASIAVFFLLLFVIATFRLTTLIMMAPAVATIVIAKRSDIRIWAMAAALGAGIYGLKEATLYLSGDAAAFLVFAANLHSGAKMTSPILSGLNPETLMNIFRAALWTTISLAFVGLFSLCGFWQTARHLKSWADPRILPLIFTILAGLGPVAVSALYHIPHPGYVAPAIPALFALAAYACKESDSCPGKLLPWLASASAACWLALWFVPSFSPTPTTKAGAVYNAMLGQYTREARLQSTWKSLSSWLMFSGQEDSVTDRRKENLKLDRRFQ